jgi:hypothetical protein
MDASEAREHLEMVERIIAASSRKLQTGGEYFIIWGVASALLNVVMQLVVDNRLPVAALWSGVVIDLIAVALSVWRARANRRESRMSVLQREFFNVLWLALTMAFVTDLIGSHLFANWAASAIWTVAGSIVLFFIAVHGNRRAMIGGIIMVASIAFANFESAYAGYALAGGMLFGYAGFGLMDILARE